MTPDGRCYGKLDSGRSSVNISRLRLLQLRGKRHQAYK